MMSLAFLVTQTQHLIKDIMIMIDSLRKRNINRAIIICSMLICFSLLMYLLNANTVVCYRIYLNYICGYNLHIVDKKLAVNVPEDLYHSMGIVAIIRSNHNVVAFVDRIGTIFPYSTNDITSFGKAISPIPSIRYRVAQIFVLVIILSLLGLIGSVVCYVHMHRIKVL